MMLCVGQKKRLESKLKNKPLEKKVLGELGCQKFIYCSDAGLTSEDIRAFNHMGERAYIVTQSFKKLKKEEKESQKSK